MRRRILAVVVALMIAGAPMALETCLIACAMSTHASEHSCHHQNDPSRGKTVAAIHICGHADGLPSGSTGQTSPIAAAAPAIDLLMLWLPTSDGWLTPLSARVPVTKPPQAISQLRV